MQNERDSISRNINSSVRNLEFSRDAIIVDLERIRIAFIQILFRCVMVVEIFSKILGSLISTDYVDRRRIEKTNRKGGRERSNESNWRTYNETLRTLSLFATNGCD